MERILNHQILVWKLNSVQAYFFDQSSTHFFLTQRCNLEGVANFFKDASKAGPFLTSEGSKLHPKSWIIHTTYGCLSGNSPSASSKKRNSSKSSARRPAMKANNKMAKKDFILDFFLDL